MFTGLVRQLNPCTAASGAPHIDRHFPFLLFYAPPPYSTDKRSFVISGEIFCWRKMWKNDLRSLWNFLLAQKVKWNKSPHAPPRISHGETIFHARRAFHKSRQGFISLKKGLHESEVLFSGGDTQNRTGESEFCRLVPYRLAMSPCLISQRKLLYHILLHLSIVFISFII